MESDDLPQRLSPIISQYEAQLHGHPTNSPLANNPVSEPFVHTPSVHVSDDHNTTHVHASPVHDPPSETGPIVFRGTIVHPPPSSPMRPLTDYDTDGYDEPPVTPVTVQPNWDDRKSVVYDKSEHPNSPEINHVLLHGVRIYDPIDPDPPIFDLSIPPHPHTRSPLHLSPQPCIQLTSPNKSNDSLSGFAGHASTVNAFTATASSNTPPKLAMKVLGTFPDSFLT